MSVNDYFLCPPIPSQFIILRTLPLSLLHRILLCIHPDLLPHDLIQIQSAIICQQDTIIHNIRQFFFYFLLFSFI